MNDELRPRTRGALAALLSLALAACASQERGPTRSLNRALVPAPVLEAQPHLVALYWAAWESAWQHVRELPRAPGRRFIDEGAIDGQVWIWDTTFMTLFCRYAPAVCPGVESLDHLYATLHDAIDVGQEVHHPDNPPLFAWAEWEHYRFTGDRRRLRWLLHETKYLQRHYAWFERTRRASPLGYSWSGNPSGMDNTPRGRGAGGHRGIFWFDALAQQALSAKLIARMADELGDGALRSEYQAKHTALRALLDKHYWDERDGTYYDIARIDPRRKSRVQTPAAFWPVLAGASSAAQIMRLRDAAIDPWRFGGVAPFPSVARTDPDFDPQGRYWRGGIWLPMAYLGTRALADNGYPEDAAALARAVIEHQYQTYVRTEPHTIWEAYSPSQAKWSTNGEGARVRPEFCGWSALGPIAMLIERHLGFHTIDARLRLVVWRKTLAGRHGIRRLRFADVTTDIVADGDALHVRSDGHYTLRVNGEQFLIAAGRQTFALRTAERDRTSRQSAGVTSARSLMGLPGSPNPGE